MVMRFISQTFHAIKSQKAGGLNFTFKKQLEFKLNKFNGHKLILYVYYFLCPHLYLKSLFQSAWPSSPKMGTFSREIVHLDSGGSL
jgi:hypothetical protein